MKKTLEVIIELKNKGLIKNYAIGGAIGVLKWTEPFFTRDLDIFIITEEVQNQKLIVLSPIYEYLKKRGYTEWIGQWIIIEGIPVEFIPTTDALTVESIENAVETEYEDIKTRVMTPEYLIALLLKAGRNKDKIKIEMLLKQAEIDNDKLQKILDKYELAEKFDNFLKELQNEQF
ncbi:MAG: nucleotidyltransferase [Candidatus Ratteibacteria bacterium]